MGYLNISFSNFLFSLLYVLSPARNECLCIQTVFQRRWLDMDGNRRECISYPREWQGATSMPMGDNKLIQILL